MVDIADTLLCEFFSLDRVGRCSGCIEVTSRHAVEVVERRILLKFEVCTVSVSSLGILFVLIVDRAEVFEKVAVLGVALCCDFVLDYSERVLTVAAESVGVGYVVVGGEVIAGVVFEESFCACYGFGEFLHLGEVKEADTLHEELVVLFGVGREHLISHSE